MPHDTIVDFDMKPRLRAEPAAPRYQAAYSLQTGKLTAIRGPQDHDIFVLDQTRMVKTGQEPIATWLTPRARALANPDFVRELLVHLHDAGVPPDRVSIELPEIAAMAITNDGLLRLSAVRDIGVGLILTGFGGAIASLAALKRLPLTAMALSPALVCNLPADREDAGLVRAAISATHVLGLAVIADGITHPAQSAWLAGQGCAAGIGPLFGVPMVAERMRDWLAADRPDASRGGSGKLPIGH